MTSFVVHAEARLAQRADHHAREVDAAAETPRHAGLLPQLAQRAVAQRLAGADPACREIVEHAGISALELAAACDPDAAIGAPAS
ncbi:MAG: hypothetical protein U1F11_10225 [Steroidobacteraceae bacterium]